MSRNVPVLDPRKDKRGQMGRDKTGQFGTIWETPPCRIHPHSALKRVFIKYGGWGWSELFSLYGSSRHLLYQNVLTSQAISLTESACHPSGGAISRLVMPSNVSGHRVVGFKQGTVVSKMSADRHSSEGN